MAILRPIDFLHTRIKEDENIICSGFVPAGFRHGFQRYDRNNRNTETEGESLGDATSGAHAGKRTGSRAESDRVATTGWDAGFRQ